MSYKIYLLLLICVAFTAGCQLNSSVSLPILKVDQECVPLREELPVGFLTDGTVLLGDYSTHAAIGQIMALAPGANHLIYLPNIPSFWGGSSSPDGKLFVYKTVDVDKDYISTLIVLNADGEIVNTLPMNEKWSGFYWLNNQQIEFPYVWDGYWQNVPPISDIVNISTGEYETIAPELPNPWIPGGPIIVQFVVWKTAYDPTLSVVGYIRGYEPEQSFVLWDLRGKRVLWELNKWTTRTIHPVWTQDGKELAVVVLNEKEDNWDRFELYLVDRNGNAEKWIDIKEHFKDDSVSLTWSPDGRYLAILPSYKEESMLILDTRRGKLLDYCMSAKIGIWSPDSTQILLHQGNDSNNSSIILDIRNGQAAYFVDNPKFIPIGWLVNSP